MKLIFAGIFFLSALLPIRAQIVEKNFHNILLNEPSRALDFKKQPFDVLNYTVQLDLSKAPAKTMSGICDIDIEWKEISPENNFIFHLRSLKVDSVHYNGASTTFKAVGEPNSADFHYRVEYPDEYSLGDFARITVYYSGTMTAEYPSNSWGGVQSSGGCLYAMGVGFSNEYVSATRHWMPCYDHPSDKATLDLTIKTPSGKTAVANGLLKSSSDTLFHWKMEDECATYLMTFAVDNYLPLHFKSIGIDPELPIVVYSKPADSALTRKSFKNLPRMVSSFEIIYTQYPFEKVGFCNTPTGAMEHQTMVSYPTFLSRSGDTVNPVAAHELAHQWWGDLVTPLDFRHAWLTESFATFSESMWAEELGGRAGFLKDQTAKIKRYIDTVTKNEGVMPLFDFPRKTPSSNYPETIYQKGAVVLGMLRYELGDSLFFGSLKSYLTKYAYGNATTDSLLKTLNDFTGRDFTPFFNQWVYGKGWPQIDVFTARQPEGFKRLRVELRQRQLDDYGVYTNLPIELGFKNSAGQTEYRLLKMTEKEQVFELDSLEDFTAVTMNEGPTVRALVQFFSLTDVEETPVLKSGKHFDIQPNPATESATIIFHAKGIATLEVFSVTGEKVFSEKIDALLGMNRFLLKTAGFANGVYVVKISDENTSSTEQLSVIR
jgi:aminopeptidase N